MGKLTSCPPKGYVGGNLYYPRRELYNLCFYPHFQKLGKVE